MRLSCHGNDAPEPPSHLSEVLSGHPPQTRTPFGPITFCKIDEQADDEHSCYPTESFSFDNTVRWPQKNEKYFLNDSSHLKPNKTVACSFLQKIIMEKVDHAVVIVLTARVRYFRLLRKTMGICKRDLSFPFNDNPAKC